jgi:Cu+-exporting ATPase
MLRFAGGSPLRQSKNNFVTSVRKSKRPLPTTFKDPVCGMFITPESAIGNLEFNGQVYYFCAPSCKRSFEKNPEKYLNTVEIPSSHHHHGDESDDLNLSYAAKTVCGGKIKVPENYPSAIYKGEQIYFCTRACLRVFNQDPEPFIAGDVEHPLEDD